MKYDKNLLEKTEGLRVELLHVVLRGLALKVLLEDVDDVVGLDALFCLVGQLLNRFWVLWLLHLPLNLLLDHILVGEVDTGGPAALGMGLDFMVHADPIRVHLKSLNGSHV